MKNSNEVTALVRSGFPLAQFGLETKEKEDAGFQYSIAPEATRSSSLHYFIGTLYLQHDASAAGNFKLDDFTVKPPKTKMPDHALLPNADYSRNAYIIEFPTRDSANHLGTQACFAASEHASFVERHLSVDEFFAPSASSQGQHKFPYAHYTENHETPDGKRIKLRVDINSDGKVVYLQIKSIQTIQGADGELREIVTYYPDALVNQLKPMALKNAEIALKLIKKLNLQKLDKFLSLHQEVNDLDRELSQLSLRLYNKKKRTQYLQLAPKFIDNIAALNALNDSRYADSRDGHIKRMRERINAGEFNPKTFEPVKKNLETTGEDEANIEASTTFAPEESNLEVSSQNPNDAKQKFKLKINTERSKLLAMIKEDKEKLKRFPKENLMGTKALIERAKILDNLRDILLALYCLPDNPQKELDSIETLEKELEKIPSLLQTFEKLAKLGEIAKVSELYPHVENNLSIPFLKGLIGDVLYNPKNNLQDRIAVCDYLHEKSALHRLVTQTFSTSFEIKRGIAFSFLAAACDLNNRLAFEMLLRQGANPNEVGFIKDNLILPTMYMILMLFKDDLFYVEKLLQYGSFLDFPNDYFSYLNAKSHLSYAPIIEQSLHQINQLPLAEQKDGDELMRTLSKKTSGLLAACTLKHPTSKLIDLLAPKSSLYGLLHSLAYFFLGKPVKSTFLATSTRAGMRFCADAVEYERYQISYMESNKSTATSMLLLCVTEQTDMQLSGIVKTLVENLNNKYQEILTKDPTQLDSLKTILMHQAKEETDLNEKQMFYIACFYLHTCNPDPSAIDKEELIKVCVEIAKICMETNVKLAYAYCGWAFNTMNSDNQKHKPQLMRCPVNQELITQLKLLQKKVPPILEQAASNRNQTQTMPTPVINTAPKTDRPRKK